MNAKYFSRRLVNGIALIAEAVECYPEHLGLRNFETQLKTSKPIDWRAILTEKAALNES